MNLKVCAVASLAVMSAYACVSQRASVCDVTQARAAQHSSLFKGLFVLLQLVQLLGTDKQGLEL